MNPTTQPPAQGAVQAPLVVRKRRRVISDTSSDSGEHDSDHLTSDGALITPVGAISGEKLPTYEEYSLRRKGQPPAGVPSNARLPTYREYVLRFKGQPPSGAPSNALLPTYEDYMRKAEPPIALPTYEEHLVRVEKGLHLTPKDAMAVTAQREETDGAAHTSAVNLDPELLLRLIQGDISEDENVQREPLARNADRMQLAEIGWDEPRLTMPVLDHGDNEKADRVIQRLLANRSNGFGDDQDTTFCAARRDDFKRLQPELAQLLSNVLSPGFKSILGEHGRCAELKRIPRPPAEALSRAGIYLSIIETNAAASNVLPEQPRKPSATQSLTSDKTYFDVYIGSAYGELGCGGRLAYYDRFLQSYREGSLSDVQVLHAHRHPHLRALMQAGAKVSMRLLGTIPDDVQPGVVYLLEGLCIDLVQTMITNAVPGSSSQAVLDTHHAIVSLETGRISDVNGLNHVHPFMQGTRSETNANDLDTGSRQCDMCLQSPDGTQWYRIPKLDAQSSGLLCSVCRFAYVESVTHVSSDADHPVAPAREDPDDHATSHTRNRETNVAYASRTARDEPLMVKRKWVCPCCQQYRARSEHHSFLSQWPKMPDEIFEYLSNELTDGITSWCHPCAVMFLPSKRKQNYSVAAFVSQRRALTALSRVKIKCPRCDESLDPGSLLGHLEGCQVSAEESDDA